MSLFTQRLRAANVSIDLLGKECGSDPLTVVEFARTQFLRDTGYDLCYCLIDRDRHPEVRFKEALRLASATDQSAKSREFRTVVSYPCIEFWFLLHFVYRRAPFVEEHDKSPAACVLVELRKHLPGYEKSARDELSKLLPLTNLALDNARKATADAQETGELNPSTEMHVVIDRIFQEAPVPDLPKA